MGIDLGQPFWPVKSLDRGCEVLETQCSSMSCQALCGIVSKVFRTNDSEVMPTLPSERLRSEALFVRVDPVIAGAQT